MKTLRSVPSAPSPASSTAPVAHTTVQRRVLLPVLLLVAAGLAGCVGDDAPRESVQGSHSHGYIHVCPDGTEIDPGHYGGHHDDDFDPASRCPTADAPASLLLSADTQQVTRFEQVTLTFDLTPASGSNGEVDSFKVLAKTGGSSDAAADYTETLHAAAAAKAPLSDQVGWAPQEAGTWTVRAFLEMDGKSLTSESIDITVDEVAPTGTVHTIKITGTGPSATLDTTSVDMVVGDAFVFVNEDAFAHTVTSADGAGLELQLEVPAGAASAEVVVYVLGEHPFVVTSHAYEGVEDPPVAQNEGKLVVKAPS